MAKEGDKQIKVLVFGDVHGNFDALFNRINTYHSKAGPFEVVFCCGEFFGTNEEDNRKLLTGQLQAPAVPVYVLGPCSQTTCRLFPETSAEIAENVTFLGSRGQLNLACGLSVAFLSGVANTQKTEWTFDEDTIAELLVPATAASKFAGVDILLTSEWPRDVHRYVHTALPRPVDGSALVAKVASVLRPRYHFAALHNIYYEREPYRNHRVLQEAAVHCTRFVSLAGVNNKDKQKFVYAFNIVPMRQLTKALLNEQPGDAGEFPYAQAVSGLVNAEIERREKQERDAGNRPQYFFDMNGPGGDEETHYKRGGKRGREDDSNPAYGKRGAPPAPMGPCWFCLSSPEVEKHMIVSIGDCCYTVIPKGPLTPGHMLILPVAHVQSLVAAEANVRKEMSRFKEALRKCIKEKMRREVVFFERNYRSQHAQVNCVPVPEGTTVDGVKKEFENAALSKNIQLIATQKDEQIWDVVAEGPPYFCVEFSDGTSLYTRQMKQFPLQFGREVLCAPTILNTPDRVDWKSIQMTKADEQTMAEKFRELFTPYDFTNEE